MNKLYILISLISLVFLSACTTTTTDNSLMFAEEGESQMCVTDLRASKADIHSVLMKILHERKWRILKSGNPIVVEQLNGMQHPRLTIYVKSGEILIDSMGSVRDGVPYVPLRYMDYIRESVIRDLSKSDYERYNSL